MGGNAALANFMGPDEDLAKNIDGRKDRLICFPCADKPLPPYFWLRDEEHGHNRKKKEDHPMPELQEDS